MLQPVKEKSYSINGVTLTQVGQGTVELGGAGKSYSINGVTPTRRGERDERLNY
jgi:hypothetical protein